MLLIQIPTLCGDSCGLFGRWRAQTRLGRVLNRLISPECDRLTEQIQRTLQFLRQQHRQLVPEQIWFTGGGGAIAGIAEAFATRLELPVRAWSLAPEQLAPNVIDISGLPLFAAAVGLSLLVEEA